MREAYKSVGECNLAIKSENGDLREILGFEISKTPNI